VLAIQLVDLIAAHLGCPDNSLLHEASDTSADADLRAPSGLCRYLSNSERTTRLGEDRKDWSIECRREGPGRITEIHDLIVHVPI
jgi:hypothetical protein